MNDNGLSSQIQEDLISFLDGIDQKILDHVCQIVVDNFQNKEKKMKANWVEISDQNVRLVWRCEDEDCKCSKNECCVDPCNVGDIGTPICEDGTDMTYIKTQIDT
jgi:hypothetical protein